MFHESKMTFGHVPMLHILFFHKPRGNVHLLVLEVRVGVSNRVRVGGLGLGSGCG
jgi:hypothetical protein